MIKLLYMKTECFPNLNIVSDSILIYENWELSKTEHYQWLNFYTWKLNVSQTWTLSVIQLLYMKIESIPKLNSIDD